MQIGMSLFAHYASWYVEHELLNAMNPEMSLPRRRCGVSGRRHTDKKDVTRASYRIE